MVKAINNINAKQNIILIIININLEPTTGWINNDTNDKINVSALSILNILNMTIKNINIRSIVDRFNNNINNEVDVDMLDMINIIIKNIDIEPTIDRVNNNIDVEIDITIFIDKIISKINIKFIMDKLHKANIIIKKEIYKFNLF